MSALNNNFEEINRAVSGVTDFIDFQSGSVNMQNFLFVDKNNSNVGINNVNPTESLDVTGNIKTNGYINQNISASWLPSTGYFPNNNDWGFFRDNNNDSIYLCYNNTGSLIQQKFNNDSFDKLTNTFSEIDYALTGINSLSNSFSQIDSILTSISAWQVPLNIYDQEMASLTGLWSSYLDIDYAASGVSTLSVTFQEIDSSINKVLSINTSAAQIDSASTFVSGLDVSAAQTNSAVSGFLNDKGQPSGFAELDSSGKVPITQLPQTAFDAVSSVNGYTGVVSLNADDIDDASTTNKFNVNADWDAASGNAEILNKPNISSFMETLIDDVDASSARETLEVKNWQSWKLGDETASATAGVKVTWYAPANGKIYNAFVGCSSPVSGQPLILDVHKEGSTIFSTGLSIDVAENTSASAISGASLISSPTTFAAGDKFEFEVDSIGSGAAGTHCDLLFGWD